MAGDFSLMKNLRKENGGRSTEGLKTGTKHYFDYTLLFIVLFIIAFGLIMIYSISAYNATKYYDDATLFVRKQALVGALSIAIMILISFCDYHWLLLRIPLPKKHSMPILFIPYAICLALQVYVWVKGDGTNGSNRWIPIGGFKFQPSELSKVLLIVFVAYIVYISPRRLDHFRGFCRILVYAFPLLLFVAVENLSTALIMTGVVFVVPFVSSKKFWYFLFTAALFAILGYLLIAKVGYRSARLASWKDIEHSAGGYQILQGLYAIASGGWFGKGLGNSIQKLGYIPEVHTDMIFTCIVEELGIIGACLLLAVYVLLLVRIFKIAANAPDLFGSLIVVGVFVQISLQIILNIAVVTNILPPTGIPLPLISYGGSSLIFLLMELGLVLSVSNRIEYGAVAVAPKKTVSEEQ